MKHNMNGAIQKHKPHPTTGINNTQYLYRPNNCNTASTKTTKEASIPTTSALAINTAQRCVAPQ